VDTLRGQLPGSARRPRPAGQATNQSPLHPDSRPYSHSIINGSYKPLIRLASASNRAVTSPDVVYE